MKSNKIIHDYFFLAALAFYFQKPWKPFIRLGLNKSFGTRKKLFEQILSANDEEFDKIINKTLELL